MKPVQVVLIIAVVISAGAAGYFSLRGSGQVTSVRAASQNNKPSAPSATPRQAPPGRGMIAPPRPVAAAYRKQFAESRSYYDFVRNAFPAAKAGNPEAQFYLSEALGFCRRGYQRYFRKASPDLPTPSLEEEIGNWTEHFPYLIGVIRNVHDKCHDLMENGVAQWGTREDWLAKATDAGLPAAQARAAELLLVDEVAQNPPTVKSREQDPRALLRSALESDEPTALLVAGTFLRIIDEINNPRLNDAQVAKERTENQFAWWLLACDRGYDCSANSPWFGEFCAGDPACQAGQTNAVDYIHLVADLRQLGDLEQRAKELNAKVEARAWGELGLGGGA